jgi:hypothetical protein
LISSRALHPRAERAQLGLGDGVDRVAAISWETEMSKERRLPPDIIDKLRFLWRKGMSPYKASLVDLREGHWKPNISECAVRRYFKEFEDEQNGRI